MTSEPPEMALAGDGEGLISATDSDQRLLDSINSLRAGFESDAAYKRGDFVAALRAAEDQVATAEALGYPYALALALNNRGLALLEMGRLNQAENDFERGREALDRNPRPASREQAYLIDQLWYHLGRVAEARGQERLDSSLTGTESASVASQGAVLGMLRPERDAYDIVNHAHHQLAQLVAASDFDRAIDVARKAVSQVSNGGPVAHGIALSNLGWALIQADRLEEACDALHASADVLREGYRPSEPLSRALMNLATASYRQGDLERALSAARDAWTEIRMAAPVSRVALSVLDLLARCRLLTGDLDRAWAAARKGLETYDAGRQGFAETELEHEQLLVAARRLTQTSLFVALHQNWSSDVFDLIDAAKARFALEQAERLRELTRPSEDVRTESRTRVLSVPAIERELIVNFFVGDEFLFVSYFDETQYGSYRRSVTADELTAKVLSLCVDIQSSSRRELWRRPAAELFNLLFEPLKERFEGSRRLVFCPDGPLWYLPLDLLTALGCGLEDALPCMQVASYRALKYHRRNERSVPWDPTVAIVARSTFGGSYRNLPETKREVQSFAETFLVDRSMVRLDGSACRESVLPLLRLADIVHIATHAIADHEGEMPSLVLAREDGSDDLISASEISGLSMRAQTVVLSACSSAIGRMSIGEGLTSIARAFLFAGCSSVIAALWPVNDSDAAQFVGTLALELHKGYSPVDALAATKRQSLAEAVSVRSVYAFQIFGDGSSRDKVLRLLDGDRSLYTKWDVP